MKGKWLSILEYSQYRGISISSVRRYIKSKKVESKRTNGKYYIFVSEENWLLRVKKEETQLCELKKRNSILERLNKELKQENVDLKMLLSLYESKNETSKVFGRETCH